VPVEVRMVQQAYKFALDPTGAQAGMLASHAGAKRFAYNFAYAMTMGPGDARHAQKKAGEKQTIPVPRQMKTPDHPGTGVEWTRFKNTAVGCVRCRRLLARDPASDAPWADARTGSLTCDPDALKRRGIDAEPGPHEPTGVSCGRCWEYLHETPGGEWAGKGGTACPEAREPGGPHDPRSDYMAWVKDIFPGTMQAAHRDADTAWQRYLSGKSRRPRFKKKGKSRESFQVHGDGVAMASATSITLTSKIGTVTVMSDDSMHPAMRRSRRRGSGVTPGRRPARKLAAAQARLDAASRAYEHAAATACHIPPSCLREVEAARNAVAKAGQAVSDAGQRDAGHGRHMGNRRRSRQLARHLRKSDEKAAALGPLLRQVRQDAGLSLTAAARLLGAEADARAVAAVRARLAAAEEALAIEEDDDERKKIAGRAERAQERLLTLEQAKPGEKASRTDRWSDAKLKKLETTGVSQGLEQASVICAAYQLGGELRERVTELAAQARMIRVSITLGADGLWWCSAGAEIPYAVRTAPSKRQAARGTAGIDFGTARVMTVTGRRPVGNPAYYEKELAALGSAQRHAARTDPGSGRNRKAKAKAGLIHADVARLRADSLHRATTSLARTRAVLGFEGFNVQQMMQGGSEGIPRKKRQRRNRSLAGAGIGMSRSMLKYKSTRYGATTVAVGPDTITITGPGGEQEVDLPPDAKPNGTCSRCGKARAKPARSHEVLYRCDACGRVRLRTLNSAENIRRWADEALTASSGCATSGPVQSRGEDEPVAVGAGRSPVKRAATPARASPVAGTGTPGG
jgi:transposase